MIAYMEASPALSGKAREFGRNYRKLALVELEPGFTDRPAMISDRAKGVARIIQIETIYLGSSPRSAGYRLREEMRARADIHFA